MNDEILDKDDAHLDWCRRKLLKGHYYDLTNKTLWNQLYNILKLEFPNLYKWEGNHDWLYLKIIKNNDSDIKALLEMREDLVKQIDEIDFILLPFLNERGLLNDE